VVRDYLFLRQTQVAKYFTERRGRSLSQVGATRCSSSRWPQSCRSLVFTRAASVITRPFLRFHINTMLLLAIRIPFRVVPHKFDRNASTRLA
jgi:hypothetical protein